MRLMKSGLLITEIQGYNADSRKELVMIEKSPKRITNKGAWIYE